MSAGKIILIILGVMALILLSIVIIGIIVLLVIVGPGKVWDVVATESFEHQCYTGNSGCIENSLSDEWASYGCGKIQIGGAVLKMNSTKGKLACIGTDIIIPEGKPSAKEMAKLTTERIKIYCCDATECVEDKTYYAFELAKYIKEGDKGIANSIEKEVSCVDAAWFEPT